MSAKHRNLESCSPPTNISKGNVPNSAFVELAEKTDRYSVFYEGSFVNTEAEIRCLVTLHLTTGVLHYPRLRPYWKPNTRCDLVASARISRNHLERLRNNLHIVDVNYPDATDRLWKQSEQVAVTRIGAWPQKEPPCEYDVPIPSRFADIKYLTTSQCFGQFKSGKVCMDSSLDNIQTEFTRPQLEKQLAEVAKEKGDEDGRNLEALNKANASLGENERLLGSLGGDGGSIQRIAHGVAAAQNGGSTASQALHAMLHGGGFPPKHV
ncbi:hypothetical protein HPB50_014143 [Hyalomma asiaticum]|uniref:Uncharacterized protein n=1 Tax=Hyalomma asiaticum TaxID=266040 RepID=A0ACB7RTX7_HYAAI|nr:hypothetical protein HPB50_014143 [Hyalomma asiaticum]